MTIKLLTPRGVIPINAIITLDSATETALVADKVATTDLTGGVVWTGVKTAASAPAPQAFSDSSVSGAGFSVSPGSTTEPAAAAWTPSLESCFVHWWCAEDARNQAGNLAAAGEAVYSIPNRINATFPLVPRGVNGAAGGASNAPIKRNGNLLNGYLPVSFGAIVSGGSTMRLGTQTGALSTNAVHRIWLVFALRGTGFPYVLNSSGSAGQNLISANGSRQIRVGTDSQVVATFTDSGYLILAYERSGTEPLFDNALAVSSVLARVNGQRVAGHTAATSAEVANVGLAFGNRWDTDVATDFDFQECVIATLKQTDGSRWRVDGYLAHKYGRQANYPGDHPYRSAPPTVPAALTARPDFDVVTAPWGYRQVCQGYMYEIQADNIQANDGAQGTDFARAFPYELKPSERARMAALMRADGSGPGIMRAAAGLYFRGVRSTNGTSGLQDGVSMERIPGQRKLVYDFLRDSNTDGIHWEYWSPAPHWKTTSDWGLGTLWAGGANSRATTLDSIRGSDPTGYANQIDAFTTAIVADMVDAHTHPQYPIRVRGFGLQNEPLGAPASYGSCLYTGQLYVDVLKSVGAKIRASTALATWGGLPNRVDIHATSWGGPADSIGTAIVADATARGYLDYWTVHQISTFNGNANAMLVDPAANPPTSTNVGQPYYNYRVASLNPTGIAVGQNEYENFNNPVLSRPQWFSNLNCVWMNFLNWMRAPFITLIHLAKPSTDAVCERYASFAVRISGDDGVPVSPDYAGGLDYNEFAINEVNYNAQVPYLRWLKGAQLLVVHEAAFSTTLKVSAWITVDNKLLVLALNAGTSAATMTIGLGREVRRMRALNYSATQRDVYADGGSVRSNVLTANVPENTLQAWVEC